MTNQAIAERAQLLADITATETKLEQLRIAERDRRADLVNALDALIYSAQRAKHKIETNQWADGCTGLYGESSIIDHVREKEDALMDLVSEINYSAATVEDLKNDYHNESYWAA